MKRIGLFLYVGVMCGLLFGEVTYAVDKTYTLDEIIVTATKFERDISETAASISLIKAEDIDFAPNMTLDEAFRYIPSVQIVRGEGVATVHNFTSIRGIGDSRNLLYVDGVSMVESMSGNVNLSFLPSSGIKKIEVLRGPSSSLYGGRGMSGVINIMSKTPEYGMHGGLKSVFGNYDYMKYSGNLSYGSEKYSINLDLSDIQTDNYWARDTIIRRDYNYRTGEYSYDYNSNYESEGHEGWRNWNRDYEERTLRSKIQFNLTDASMVSFVFGTMDNETGNGYTDRYTDAEGNDLEKHLDKEKTYAGITGDTKINNDTVFSYRLTYHKPESRNSGENMNLSLSLDDPAQLAPGGRAPRFYNALSVQGSDDYEAEAKLTASLLSDTFGEHIITMGSQYMRNDIYWSIEEIGTGLTLTNPVDATKDTWSFYAQDEYIINQMFTLTAGLRGDFYDDFDDQVSPKISLLYKHNPSTQYFISGGYAYNPPSYSDKFGTDWNMTSYTIRTNNPNLDAEKLRSIEVGFRKAINQNFRSSITAYYSKAKDLIESIKERHEIGGAGSGVFMTYEYHDNIDEATMKGIESELSYQITDHHRITGNLTYMKAKNEETGQRLERSPNWLGSIAYHYSQSFGSNTLRGTIRGRGQDNIYIGEYSVDEPRKVSGFFVMDMSINFDIGKYISLFVDATNLMDKDYREFTYTRYQPGRVLVGGCEVRF